MPHCPEFPHSTNAVTAVLAKIDDALTKQISLDGAACKSLNDIDIYAWIAPCGDVLQLAPNRPARFYVAIVNHGVFEQQVRYEVDTANSVLELTGEKMGNKECETEKVSLSYCDIVPQVSARRETVSCKCMIREGRTIYEVTLRIAAESKAF